MFDDETMQALKRCLTGGVTKEITSEYVFDEEKKSLVMTKQKINEKTIPPSADLMKILFQKLSSEEVNYDAMTDEELAKEKFRLLKELKELEDDSGESKT